MKRIAEDDEAAASWHAHRTDRRVSIKRFRAMKRFFDEGDKVKVTLRFRGREMAHQELGMQLLRRLKDEAEGFAKVEVEPRLGGRQMVMILAPR
jgi:translation initiation factor IF-3